MVKQLETEDVRIEKTATAYLRSEIDGYGMYRNRALELVHSKRSMTLGI